MLGLEAFKSIRFRAVWPDWFTYIKVFAFAVEILIILDYYLQPDKAYRTLNQTQWLIVSTMCLFLVFLYTVMRMFDRLRIQLKTILEIIRLTKGVFGLFFFLVFMFGTLFYMNNEYRHELHITDEMKYFESKAFTDWALEFSKWHDEEEDIKAKFQAKEISVADY